jgi:hypothetical protein
VKATLVAGGSGGTNGTATVTGIWRAVSVAAMQALNEGLANGDRCFVNNKGVYRAEVPPSTAALGSLAVTSTDALTRWVLEDDGADYRPVFNAVQYGMTAGTAGAASDLRASAAGAASLVRASAAGAASLLRASAGASLLRASAAGAASLLRASAAGAASLVRASAAGASLLRASAAGASLLRASLLRASAAGSSAAGASAAAGSAAAGSSTFTSSSELMLC